jgi:hypothetical protein
MLTGPNAWHGGMGRNGITRTITLNVETMRRDQLQAPVALLPGAILVPITGVRRITTFRSTANRIYEGGTILYYIILYIILYYITTYHYVTTVYSIQYSNGFVV